MTFSLIQGRLFSCLPAVRGSLQSQVYQVLLPLDYTSGVLYKLGCRSFVFNLFMTSWLPRANLDGIGLTANHHGNSCHPEQFPWQPHQKKKKKTRSYLIGQSTGVFTLGGVMGRHVCQMSASNHSLHPPLPPPPPPPPPPPNPTLPLFLHPQPQFPGHPSPISSPSSTASSVPSLFFLFQPTPPPSL